jgi:acetyltransferase-like isoleucine patch superfamily enzyme
MSFMKSQISKSSLPKKPGKVSRLLTAAFCLINPMVYLHLFKIINFYNYGHIRPKRLIQMGKSSSIAPNVSLRNGARIKIGENCRIGERSYLWAGNTTGRIIIGDHVSLAPEVFITAADYQFEPDVSFRDQPMRERDVVIGDGVWLGARVTVTSGVTIGAGCIVGAGAVVTKDLPENAIAAGVPARIISNRKSTSQS